MWCGVVWFGFVWVERVIGKVVGRVVGSGCESGWESGWERFWESCRAVIGRMGWGVWENG